MMILETRKMYKIIIEIFGDEFSEFHQDTIN